MRTFRNRAFLRFLVVGVLNTAVGYLLFALLILAGIPAQPALAIAFAGGVLWNYTTHARLVFGTRGLAHLPAYILAYLALYGINASGFQVLLVAGLAPIIAQGILVLPVAMVSYVVIGRVLTGRFPWTQNSG